MWGLDARKVNRCHEYKYNAQQIKMQQIDIAKSEDLPRVLKPNARVRL